MSPERSVSVEERAAGNPLGYQPIGRLLLNFSIPSVISMLVNSIYNIVDQIFIGQGVGELGMEDRADHRPAEMSGGQQQRVAIARAIATHPPVIMADEPTGALDSKTGRHVLEILHTLHEEGSTVILITHDNGIAATAERIVRLSDGHIVSDGTREEVGL